MRLSPQSRGSRILEGRATHHNHQGCQGCLAREVNGREGRLKEDEVMVEQGRIGKAEIDLIWASGLGETETLREHG